MCHYFKQEPTIALTGTEVLIKAEVCQAQRQLYPEPGEGGTDGGRIRDGGETGFAPGPIPGPPPPGGGPGARHADLTSLRLSFTVPKGKVASLMGVMNLLQSRFARMDVTLSVDGGQLTEQDYEDKIKEAFRQMGVEVREEV